MSYYFAKTVNLPFEKAIEKVTEELQKDGFGVLTEIDVKETLKKKLDVNFKKYKILGACNPPFAYRALQAEDKIGLMLPCNVVVEEIDSEHSEVSAVDPIASMAAIKNEKLADTANEVQKRLKSVIERL